MYRFGTERLNIDSVIFDDMRDQFNVLLNALLQEANISGKEGELTLKLKVSTATERNYKKGTLVSEWTEPRFSWTVARKVKELKFDVKSSSGHGFVLSFDDEGKPIFKEAPNKQLSLEDMPREEQKPYDELDPQEEDFEEDEMSEEDELGLENDDDETTPGLSPKFVDKVLDIIKEKSEDDDFEDEMRAQGDESEAGEDDDE